MVWRDSDPQGGESLKVRHLVVPYTRGHGLDIGAGPWRVWPHVITFDNGCEYQGATDPLTGQRWHADVHGDAEDLSRFADEGLDFVFSSHTLEHLLSPDLVLAEWWRVIKPGGYLILYLPHADLYPNIGQPGANPDHETDMRPEDVEKWMEQIGSWDLVVNETRAKGTEYSFLSIFKKLDNPT